MRKTVEERFWAKVSGDSFETCWLWISAVKSGRYGQFGLNGKGMTSRVLRQEFPHLRKRLPTLWSRSYFVSTVGSVSAATIQRYIETQWERPWRKTTP